MEKEKLFHCWWGCKLVKPLWKSVWWFLRKLDIVLPEYSAIPLLGINPKVDPISNKDTCSTMFIAALCIIARRWKEPRCPSTEKWIKKLWYVYTMEYYSVIKNEFVKLQAGITTLKISLVVLQKVGDNPTQAGHLSKKCSKL